MNKLIDFIKKPLVTYLLVVIVGLVAHYGGIEWLEELYGALDVAAAVALAMFALWGYREYGKQEESVRIVFEVNGELKETNLILLRKDCTRSELMGVLGMIQKDPKTRFEIASIKKVDFLQTLVEIQKGKTKELVISLSEDELKQFHTEE